jgi:hypothetical protein
MADAVDLYTGGFSSFFHSFKSKATGSSGLNILSNIPSLTFVGVVSIF